MEQYNSIQQLLKKENGHDRKPIYPSTVIQAVFDAKTGASLEAILAQFNSIYVQYQGSPQATRSIIPVEMRRAGLMITYMNMDGETITEKASSAVQKDNDHWGLDVNWSRVDELSLSGDIAVSANGTWIINGVDTKIPARGSKGDAGLTPWLKTIDNKLHYSYDNATWEPCSDYLAGYFRFNATSSDSQAGTIGKIQISKDNKTWQDLSPEFRNYLRIQGYVASTSALPNNQVVGTIYGVNEGTNTYSLHVWDGSTWVNNGTFTSIAAGVVQETGNSETEVMSQKAVTEKLSELGSEAGLKGVVFTDGSSTMAQTAINVDWEVGKSYRFIAYTNEECEGSVIIGGTNAAGIVNKRFSASALKKGVSDIFNPKTSYNGGRVYVDSSDFSVGVKVNVFLIEESAIANITHSILNEAINAKWYVNEANVSPVFVSKYSVKFKPKVSKRTFNGKRTDWIDLYDLVKSAENEESNLSFTTFNDDDRSIVFDTSSLKDNTGIILYQSLLTGEYGVSISKYNLPDYSVCILYICTTDEGFYFIGKAAEQWTAWYNDWCLKNESNGIKSIVLSEEKLVQMKSSAKKPDWGGKYTAPLVLLHFSDMHSDKDRYDRILSYKSKFSKYIDCAIHTGDAVKMYYSDDFSYWSDNTILNCIGNHETCTDNTTVEGWTGRNALQSYEQFIKPFIGSWNVVQPDYAETDGACYYYKDFNTQKIRIVVLDGMHYDDAQNNWLSQVINDTLTNNMHLIVASHFIPSTTLHNSESLFDTMYPSNPWETDWTGFGLLDTRVSHIVENFIQQGGDFICYLAGHVHDNVFRSLTKYPNQYVICADTAACEGFASSFCNDHIKDTMTQDNFNLISFDVDNSRLKLCKIATSYDRNMREFTSMLWDWNLRKIIYQK